MTTTFSPLHTRYLSRSFFQRSCSPTVEIIDYYGLGNLVYCTSPVNTGLCAELYNNLVKIDDLTYTTRVMSRDIILTPSVLREHLGLRQSECTFICYPPRDLPFGDPYSHITLDMMYSYFFGEQRVPTVSQFSSLRLRVQDYVLYRVIVTCILPLSTRDVAMMRPFHSFLLYAFRHRLDIDISLLLFHVIIYSASIYTSKRVRMPYCHILTSLLAALGFDIHIGELSPLTEFDMIGVRQFSLARIDIDSVTHALSWRRDDQPQPDPEEEMPDVDITDLLSSETPPAPQPSGLEDRLTRLEQLVVTLGEQQTAGFQRLREEQQARHVELMEMLRSWNISSSSHFPPPPSD